MRKENGITLVALVITIIVLLILAGVTINLTLGERGIFRIAEKAAKNYRDSQQEEMYGLNSLQNEINDTISEIGQGTTNTETSTVPNGENVEANSITTWLKCAKIEDKYSYKTLEEVVADNACTESLMNNENAMEYLERSTEFADGICANESAMTNMGHSAYVDNTVLNSDVWVEKIAMSPYWNKVSNISVVLHGATSETITINGLYGSPTVTTNSAGDVNYQLPIGKFTFSGSVSGKSFERTISKKTTEVYVMPEGHIIYWYGFTKYQFTNCRSWYSSGGTVKHNLNNVSFNSNGGQFGIDVNQRINMASYSSLHTIGESLCEMGGLHVGINSMSLDQVTWSNGGNNGLASISYSLNDGSSCEKILDLTNYNSTYYVIAHAIYNDNSGLVAKMYAIWLE